MFDLCSGGEPCYVTVYFSAMQNGTSDLHNEFGNDEKETNEETELEEVVVDNPVNG